MNMKRLACLFLVVFLLPACACALDLDSFNTYAAVFGEAELSESGAISANGLTVIKAGACRVTFSEDGDTLKRIIVEGDGVPFLAYSMAAIMQFDPDSANYADNAGQLLSAFLLCRSSGEGAGKTVSGNTIYLQRSDTAFLFTVGK
jgi:hypothetical protein